MAFSDIYLYLLTLPFDSLFCCVSTLDTSCVFIVLLLLSAALLSFLLLVGEVWF